MTRRSVLLAAFGASACAPRRTTSSLVPPKRNGPIQTVTGAISADRMGVTLMHEHVLVDFVGAEQAGPGRYDQIQAFTAIVPHLRQVQSLGCETIVECTPAYLGRDARLLQRLAEASGVRLLTNTGYYGAAKDRYLPRHAFSETAEQLAARWIREVEHGIDGTAIRPAIMKIGVDEAPLSDVDAKLVRAAALTHRETGLPIASHTSTGRAAIEQLDLFDTLGVPPFAFVWVHAHNERDPTYHVRVAERQAWVEFDGIAPTTVDRHVALVREMRVRGLLAHVLVSQDAGWYRVGEPDGGQFRPYDTLFTTFVPALRAAGFDDRAIRQLLVINPARVLSGADPSASSAN